MAHEHRLEVYRGNGRVDNVLGEDTQITTMTAAMTVGVWDKISVSLALPVIRTEYRILRHQTLMECLCLFRSRTGICRFYADHRLHIDEWNTPRGRFVVEYWRFHSHGRRVDYPQLSGRDFGEVLTLSTSTWDPIIIHGLSNEGPVAGMADSWLD